MSVVTLYGRPGCGLCDSARRELDEMRTGGLEFTTREVNIDNDPELLARYLERIPVIEVEGDIVSELGLDANAVRAQLDTVSQ